MSSNNQHNVMWFCQYSDGIPEPVFNKSFDNSQNGNHISGFPPSMTFEEKMNFLKSRPLQQKLPIEDIVGRPRTAIEYFGHGELLIKMTEILKNTCFSIYSTTSKRYLNRVYYKSSALVGTDEVSKQMRMNRLFFINNPLLLFHDLNSGFNVYITTENVDYCIRKVPIPDSVCFAMSLTFLM